MIEPQSLLTLAEISVGIAGFSAIVVLFKRRESGAWHAAHADRFNGMVIHAMCAAFFCLLPSAIGIFTATPSWIWAIASSLFGVQVLAHSILIAFLPTTRRSDYPQLVVGFGAAAILLLNGAGWGFDRDFAPYLSGIFWHLFSAGMLFVYLVWIPEADIQRS